MDTLPALQSLGIALLLGLLVGLQRERTDSLIAGIRTFPLITLLGALTAILSEPLGGWIVAAGLLGVAAVAFIGNLAAIKQNADARGITTEVAMLVMFCVGALTHIGPKSVAVAVGVAAALLLHAKPMLHAFTAKLGDEDVRAIMRFALITFIILPVVPDEPIGPLRVVNPHHVWLMVVLVVGISLLGYVAHKVLGPRRGLLAAGFLGGLISSTATTVAHARRARSAAAPSQFASIFVISVAGVVLYARMMAEIAIVAPAHAHVMLPPIAALAAVAAVLAAVVWRFVSPDGDPPDSQANPSELKTAIVFALLYAGVTLAVAYAQRELGNTGLFAVAAISGLTDMDAITLSTSKLAQNGTIDPHTAWRAIVVANCSNIIFKFGLACTIAGSAFARKLAPVTLVLLTFAAAIALFWPRP
jgi:uncharacterized membrane protein (DUF4010 family)